MSLVKICGLTREEDVELVRREGVDFAGFVFAAGPRRVDPKRARELIALLEGSSVRPVGVFVNEDPARVEEIARITGITHVQLHGDEPEGYLASWRGKRIRAIAVRNGATLARLGRCDGDYLLLDAWDGTVRGGTGKTFRWELARDLDIPVPLFLAGGLDPDNVTEAIRLVRPAGVDVSSGVEKEPGIKDARKVRSFVERARRAFSAEGGDS